MSVVELYILIHLKSESQFIRATFPFTQRVFRVRQQFSKEVTFFKVARSPTFFFKALMPNIFAKLISQLKKTWRAASFKPESDEDENYEAKVFPLS